MVEKDICSNCANFKICKYKEAYEELAQQAASNLEVKEPFKVVLVCPHFSRSANNPGFYPSGVTYRSNE